MENEKQCHFTNIELEKLFRKPCMQKITKLKLYKLNDICVYCLSLFTQRERKL